MLFLLLPDDGFHFLNLFVFVIEPRQDLITLFFHGIVLGDDITDAAIHDFINVGLQFLILFSFFL